MHGLKIAKFGFATVPIRITMIDMIRAFNGFATKRAASVIDRQDEIPLTAASEGAHNQSLDQRDRLIPVSGRAPDDKGTISRI